MAWILNAKRWQREVSDPQHAACEFAASGAVDHAVARQKGASCDYLLLATGAEELLYTCRSGKKRDMDWIFGSDIRIPDLI